MVMKKIVFFVLFVLLLTDFSTLVSAEEHEGEWELLGVEAEELFDLGSGILALVLCILTLAAYQRTKKKKLLYVSGAFALFAFKGFLTSLTELFFEELIWVDPLASVLNFAILLLFFIGVLKK
jgi:hypothetical protein